MVVWDVEVRLPLRCRSGEVLLSGAWGSARPVDAPLDEFHGRFGRVSQPSDSDEGTSEPDPDLTSG